jgi:hypothetical protein
MLRGNREERDQLHIEVIGTGGDVNIVDHKPLRGQTDVAPTRLCECVFPCSG